MVRPYRRADTEALWELKRGFELGLATDTGDEEKETTYRGKLDEAYRSEYLAWVDRCTDENDHAVQLVERNGSVVGYVFVLPESFAYIWDAAVLNEIFVTERFRGTDVGDELMAAALSVVEAQDLPLDRIVLDVDPANDRATAFYRRWGFDEWGTMMALEL